MSTAWLIAACLVIGQAEIRNAGDAQPALVRQLVRQLDAPEKARRDEAERRLLELGPAIASLLPTPSGQLPAEVQLRLARIRDQFDEQQAKASTESSRVTLDSSSMPLADILAALEKQSGNKLVDLRAQFGEAVNNDSLAVHFHDTPFWPALDNVVDRAGLALQTVAGAPGIALATRSETALASTGRVRYAGAFRIEATRLVAQRDLRNPSLDGLSLQLDVAWEPRLKPIALFLPSERIRAEDERGKPLALAGSEHELEVNTSAGSCMAALPVNFALPPRSVERIARLSGSLRAMVPGRMADFRFDGLDHIKRTEQRHAGVTVVLDSVHKNNAIWEIAIRVKFDTPGQALESHRGWILNNEAWLVGPDGDKLAYAGMETTRQSESEVGVAYLFAPPEEIGKYAFVYRTPSSIAHVWLPFEIKDLKLP